MNIRRIIGYAIALLVLRVAMSFVASGLLPQDADAQLIQRYTATYVADAFVVTAMIAKLAKQQVQATWLHVLLVVLLQELLGVVVLSMVGHGDSPSPLWFVDWIVLGASTVLGVLMGLRLRVRNVS